MNTITYDYTSYNEETMNTIKTWAQSSVDPEQLANTIRGLVLTGASIITFLGMQFFNITLSANDIANLATNLGIAAGAIWTVYGIILKGVMWFASTKTPTV